MTERDDMADLLTVAKVAKLTGYSEGHLRRMLGQGLVKTAKRLGYTWLIPASEVEKLRRRRSQNM